MLCFSIIQQCIIMYMFLKKSNENKVLDSLINYANVPQ